MGLSLAAQLLAIPTAFVLSGYNTAFSQNGTPNLLGQPTSISTHVFTKIYYSGLAFVTPTAVTSVAAFGHLAYVNRHRPTQRNLYLAGAALVLSVGLFTAIVMKPGISRLIAISEDKALQLKTEETGEASKLLQAWVMQNWFRASLSFAGGMAGLYAAIS